MTCFTFPSKWEKVELSDIAIFQNGYAFKSSTYIDSGDFVIRIGNVHDTGINLNNPAYVNATELNAEKFRLSQGDILMSLTGNVGRTAFIKEEHLPAVLNQRVAKVAFSSLIEKKFSFYLLRSNIVQSELLKCAKGAAQLNISTKDLDKIVVGIPSIREQKIIAEKLDTLLAQVDSTKARLEQIPQILKRFRQAVLAAAVRGELTEGWHTDQNLVSAKSILNEIETERSQAKNNKLIKQSFGKYKVISPLFNVPSNSWEWVCLEQICATNNNALKAGPFGSALKKADCVEVGYKVYGQEQVISGSESLETYRINDDKYEQLKSCTTGPGDILISLVGTIGKVLVLSPQAEFGIINPRLVKITLHNTISPQYIKTYLDSPVSHSFFKGFSHGGTMEILNLSILKELPIALPPLEEQHEIVRRVEQLFAYADTIEKQVNNVLTRVNSLTQSILAKAFRGELTAQWRAENPSLISGENSAAALLEKIKAERAASGGKKTSRKKA
ncbi:restriction endonuclease subunit S [Salmonella enterica subsp. enterica serovar Havana]|nr:restriction endonuclease subunit S [Salmonella enterica subsp. enterica serovar Havana]